ncbi:50S ribosomal protein L24 [Candidatus Pacearchaeota archaeon]|nr:50S ribosomal protein L24 [Candidatus Pacearchaeota archaeon]
MKKKFSTAWKASSQTRKQRKYLANAPIHTQRKIMASHLSKELRSKYKKRSFPIRKDDEVKIMRGKFKGKTGKIANIDRPRKRVAIEGIQRKKKDGTKINIFFNSSVLQIQKLNLEDKKRVKALERREAIKKVEKKEVKKTDSEKVKEDKK